MNQASPPPAFARPAFVEEAKSAFAAALAAHPDVECVDALIVDIAGTLRGKRLPVAEAGRLFVTGMQLPRSVYLMDVKGEMVNPFGRGFGDGDPDGTAWPVPGTVARVWGEGPRRLQLLTTMRNDDGTPTAGEPRAALERALARFADLRLTPVVALELEFYLIDRARDANGAPQPLIDPRTGLREKDNAVYAIADLDRYRAFHAALNEAARVQNLPVSAASSEYAPGQFEINLHHQPDALRAADHGVFLKQVVRAAAVASGFEATFMAKPYPDRIGSGLHIHASILDASGRNVFDDGTPQGSDALRHAVGGLQALMPESMALFAPSVNSYRRFQPDMFAPVNRRWGYNNRSAGMRVPLSPGEARRIEHRAAGADANPYFALAAVLAGLHHGLVDRIDPGPPAAGNVSGEPDLALPFTIDEALVRLKEARILPSYLGEETAALYGETKRLETARFRKLISPAEYDWYL
ncbi:MAG TPA: glutamine synthetase family protein [Rhizomicrobium sp.]|nr:glutamine synthetase family protein [Rhizomicrobium sp.]